MIGKIVSSIFGSKQERDVRKLEPLVDEINTRFEQMKDCSDEELRHKTEEFRERLEQGETLDGLLPEAYAVVKEACRRLIGATLNVTGHETEWDMVPFDVQLAGAVVLHQGKIAEMATGEGKTLVATMPLYLNGLRSRGAHLVTVNDYLAQRDSEWMGKVYEFLGMSVGCILTDMMPAQRRTHYSADITYGTNNEFGFDYLRDNMAIDREDLVQRGHHYAIVDEVDSVLVDEARTPLIISGAVDRSTHRYDKIKPIVAELVHKQNLLVNRLLGEAEDLLEQEGNGYEAGRKLLLAQRGAPKNKRYLKLRSEAANQKLTERVEVDYMRDKRMPELDAELFFVIDEKAHTIDLTDKGREALAPENPDMFVLKDIVDEVATIEARTDLVDRQKEKYKEEVRLEHEVKKEELHNIAQLLRAYSLFEKDVEYVVQDNRVIIVDEFTGRLMPGRRYSDGLHQAIEAKEGVKIEKETQTLATITLQNYFRMYEKLSGMTGTAETEAQEFHHTYKMDVVVIPTNKPVRRIDYNDQIYRTKREKYNAIIDEIERLHNAGLPVLVGTVSVEVSETLSRMLRRRGISHSVLNAKYHQKEAEIIREAGKTGAVTIATNMAGRGTDIKLGAEVVKCDRCCIECDLECGSEAGCAGERTRNDYAECHKDVPCGLQVMGTERHEARRIDRQLRGRGGRQGDPGASRFFISLEDDLMRLFGSERIASIMTKFGMQEGERIEHPWITKAVESAQKKIEQINFERRKHTLEYDDVMNKQREAIYSLRREVLLGDDLKNTILDICYDAMLSEAGVFGADERMAATEWDATGFLGWVQRMIPYQNVTDVAYDDTTTLEELVKRVMEPAKKAYEIKETFYGKDLMHQIAKAVTLRIIDSDWQDHLLAIDELREGIGLRGYAQLDPLVEYQRDATRMFEEMMRNIYKEVFEHFFRTEIVTEEQRGASRRELRFQKEAYEQLQPEARRAMAAAEGGGEEGAPPPKPQPVRVGPKVGRNDPCPCGSGKKYKKCCGAKTASVPHE